MRDADLRGIFLDTTFLLPFFQIQVKVKAFTPLTFEEWLRTIDQVHVSELSIYEAKAKIYGLSKADPAYRPALRAFGENLEILRADKRFLFHTYSKDADDYFNSLMGIRVVIDAFDAIILSQAARVGFLLTEDRDILKLRDAEGFRSHPLLSKVKIKNWFELTRTS